MQDDKDSALLCLEKGMNDLFPSVPNQEAEKKVYAQVDFTFTSCAVAARSVNQPVHRMFYILYGCCSVRQPTCSPHVLRLVRLLLGPSTNLFTACFTSCAVVARSVNQPVHRMFYVLCGCCSVRQPTCSPHVLRLVRLLLGPSTNLFTACFTSCAVVARSVNQPVHRIFTSCAVVARSVNQPVHRMFYVLCGCCSVRQPTCSPHVLRLVRLLLGPSTNLFTTCFTSCAVVARSVNQPVHRMFYVLYGCCSVRQPTCSPHVLHLVRLLLGPSTNLFTACFTSCAVVARSVNQPVHRMFYVLCGCCSVHQPTCSPHVLRLVRLLLGPSTNLFTACFTSCAVVARSVNQPVHRMFYVLCGCCSVRQPTCSPYVLHLVRLLLGPSTNLFTACFTSCAVVARSVNQPVHRMFYVLCGCCSVRQPTCSPYVLRLVRLLLGPSTNLFTACFTSCAVVARSVNQPVHRMFYVLCGCCSVRQPTCSPHVFKQFEHVCW